MSKAEAIMREYNVDNRSIISQDPWPIMHTSLQYFCCQSASDKKKIVEVLHSYKWEPFNLTYASTACNIASDGVISLYSVVDLPGQLLLWGLVGKLEELIEQAGVTLTVKRKELFHSTLGQVTAEYPTDQVVQLLNQELKQGYNPMFPVQVKWYFMGDQVFVAQL